MPEVFEASELLFLVGASPTSLAILDNIPYIENVWLKKELILYGQYLV